MNSIDYWASRGQGMSIWGRTKGEAGQTTAEYALVLIAAATVAVVLITWASGDDNGLKEFFHNVMVKLNEKMN